jgi:hypothetical protein
MKHSTLIALSTLTMLGVGCTTSTPHSSPFKVSEQEIRDRVKIVAVAPLPVDDDLPNDSQVREEFATLLINELNSLGFQTVPPVEYEQIFNRLRDEVGGFYDPITGKGDKEKYKKVQDLCRRELATKFHVDAILYSSFISFSVPFTYDVAVWCGTKEYVSDASWFQRAFASSYGRVSALSLSVVLMDTDGNKMYSRCGGIQLLAKATTAYTRIPDSKLLTDHERNANSVKLALEPFRAEEPVHHSK